MCKEPWCSWGLSVRVPPAVLEERVAAWSPKERGGSCVVFHIYVLPSFGVVGLFLSGVLHPGPAYLLELCVNRKIWWDITEE